MGRILSGRFRIERLIGMGSMGVVLAARHLELGTRVAIKAMRPEMQAIPGMRSLFAREAKAAFTLRSAHVAQVFDIGTDEELGPYIVMEYLAGKDLRALLEQDGRVPFAHAVDYILQACEALAVAHAKGVIHRDIKPENLFLTRQGDLEIVKLLDFGVSQAVLSGRVFGGDLSTQETAGLMGTPPYMSPEQIRLLERVDHRADIWALGAVLFELVTGRSAFGCEAFGGAAFGVLSGEVGAHVGMEHLPALLDHICQAAPGLIADHCAGPECQLQGVIEQCLDKNPARRFQNVAELAYALVPFASARSQVHAQRAAAILGTGAAGASLPLSRQPAAAPSGLFRDNVSGTRLRPSLAALATLATPPNWARPRALVLGRGRAPRSVLVGALSLAAVLLGVVLLALGTLRRAEDTVSVAAPFAEPALPVLRRYALPEAEALPPAAAE
ncbi:MAG: hypothetical protein RL685_3648 [Pseudomonadota bacterium]